MPEYLEDIKKDHDDNFNRVWKESKGYILKSLSMARTIRMSCMSEAMKMLGCDTVFIMEMATSPETAGELIDDMMRKHNITVENWNDKDCDPHRRGIYVYKAGEIAYFISNIERIVNDDGTVSFRLETNVKFD
jgi:hypothetical protein